MSKNYVFHAGEATVLAAEGQFTDAMPEILIGRTDGPVGQAFANMMAQSKGHTAMFAIRACNQMVRPVTITPSPAWLVRLTPALSTQLISSTFIDEACVSVFTAAVLILHADPKQRYQGRSRRRAAFY